MSGPRRAKTPPAGSSRDRPAPQPKVAGAGRTRDVVRQLYNGSGRRAVSFRYGLLAFDLFTVTFVVASSFFLDSPLVAALDVVFGVAILVEFSMRLFISRSLLGELVHPLGLADLIAIASFLAPAPGGSFGFLRVVRALRLFRSYRLVARLQRDFPFFKRNQDAVFSVVNLLVFILIMTALVHASQFGRNPEITNYADALYFTVTTLTTTGFGDITMDDTTGRLLAVLIMIFGVSLFIRLAQTLFRPTKVHHECEECGLTRHDADAVHCKHCGTVIHIETEGQD
jgi:voltage-gated potassium channel